MVAGCTKVEKREGKKMELLACLAGGGSPAARRRQLGERI
jgi:hypothetical protein